MRALIILAACLGCWIAHAKDYCSRRGINEDHCCRRAVNEGQNVDMDVVYTYVNGNDKEFVREKTKHEHPEVDATDQKNSATRTSDAVNTRRFTDHDELRMSIRSVIKHMDWVRCIYIVVADGPKQIPEWFNADQGRVKIIFHKEIFQDAEALPTYNSHAIEANLYHIKLMARFFLYMNDDFYINAPVKVSDFIDIRTLKMKPSFKANIIDGAESKMVRKMAYTAANINNKNILEKLDLVDPSVEHYLTHVGYIQDRAAFAKIMHNQEVAEQQQATSKRRFRNSKDLWFIGLTTLFDYKKGAPKSTLHTCYIENKQLKSLQKEIAKCIQGPRAREYSLLCINDVLDTDKQNMYKLVQDTLLKTWPKRSLAEKDEYLPDRKPDLPDPEDRDDEVNEEVLNEDPSKEADADHEGRPGLDKKRGPGFKKSDTKSKHGNNNQKHPQHPQHQSSHQLPNFGLAVKGALRRLSRKTKKEISQILRPPEK